MFEIHITLLSETTFGRGDGVSGLVDQEVEHDSRTGLPFLRGRTLKGLLVEGCADIFYGLGAVPEAVNNSAEFLFGTPGSTISAAAHMNVGAAQLPEQLRDAIRVEVADENSGISAETVLQSLTTLRRQTSVDNELGTPASGSLRSMRVLLRQTTLIAPLTFSAEVDDHLPLLAACIASVRRGGIGRNRGRGRLSARLYKNGNDETDQLLKLFQKQIGG